MPSLRKPRFLLCNFEDSPENMHLESAFVRHFNRGTSGTLDIIHCFTSPYAFMNPPPDMAGERVHAADEPRANALLRRQYDAAVFIDVPIKMHRMLFFARTLCAVKTDRFYFVANHLAPDAKKLRSAQIAENKKILSRFEAGYLLEFEDLSLWEKMGLPAAKQRLRPYCIDCNYYSPAARGDGDYIISAGSTGRDFDELLSAVRDTPYNLKIISNSEVKVPDSLLGRVEILPFNKNIGNLKNYIAESAGAVVPVRDEHLNPTAGMAVTFMAMACAKPAVCRRTDWMAHYVRDGENGFMYPKLSAAALRDILLRLSKMTAAQKRMLGAAARKTMLETASLDKLARDITTRIKSSLKK
jgi:glycosyltransferase involved in cell wall biosynthesis